MAMLNIVSILEPLAISFTIASIVVTIAITIDKAMTKRLLKKRNEKI